MTENIYNKQGKLIGQNWQRNNGKWMHKWIDFRTNDFDKFSWGEKAEGEDIDSWTYEKHENNKTTTRRNKKYS